MTRPLFFIACLILLSSALNAKQFTLDPDEERENKLRWEKEEAYIERLLKNYPFKLGLTMEEFMKFSPDAAALMNSPYKVKKGNYIPIETLIAQQELIPGLVGIGIEDNKYRPHFQKVRSVRYALALTKDSLALRRQYDSIAHDMKTNAWSVEEHPASEFRGPNVEIVRSRKKEQVIITLIINTHKENKRAKEQWYELDLSFTEYY